MKSDVPVHGVFADRIAQDPALAGTLRADDMERFRAVPKTVMINPWQDDLDWLIVDRSYPCQIARRHELLLCCRDMVIDRLPGDDVRSAEAELRDAVADYLPARYPRYFRRENDLILSPLSGLAIDVGPRGADPLVALALLASEDLLLLLPEVRGPQRKTVYLLKAGALLFPNGWSLRSRFARPEPAPEQAAALQRWREERRRSLEAARLGRTPHEIHAGHVAHYVEHFADRVDLFFAQMMPGQLAWRRNWGPKMSGELFLHSDALPAGLPEPTPSNWAEYGYLRSEHETFTKLPHSGAVVFGIKTYLWKLSELAGNRRALEALFAASDNLAPKMSDYRADTLPSFRQFLEAYRTTPA